MTRREIIGLLAEPEPYLGCFVGAATRAVADHADAVIPAEGILAEIVAANGVTSVDGAAVLDGVAIPVAYAEMLVKLWRGTGLRVGRRWHHARPPAELLDLFLSRLP